MLRMIKKIYHSFYKHSILLKNKESQLKGKIAQRNETLKADRKRPLWPFTSGCRSDMQKYKLNWHKQLKRKCKWKLFEFVFKLKIPCTLFSSGQKNGGGKKNAKKMKTLQLHVKWLLQVRFTVSWWVKSCAYRLDQSALIIADDMIIVIIVMIDVTDKTAHQLLKWRVF